jgi:isochorismate pyruvate lyase
MTRANECTTMAEVREEIDRLDRAIVGLMAERCGYIAAAARIKQQRSTVRDDARIDDVLSKVRASAAAHAAPEAVIVPAYRALIEASIAYELEKFDGLKS